MDFMKRKGYALIVADVSVYHLLEVPAEVAANAGELLTLFIINLYSYRINRKLSKNNLGK